MVLVVCISLLPFLKLHVSAILTQYLCPTTSTFSSLSSLPLHWFSTDLQNSSLLLRCLITLSGAFLLAVPIAALILFTNDPHRIHLAAPCSISSTLTCIKRSKTNKNTFLYGSTDCMQPQGFSVVVHNLQNTVRTPVRTRSFITLSGKRIFDCCMRGFHGISVGLKKSEIDLMLMSYESASHSTRRFCSA